MATLTLRTVVARPLTNLEVDGNFQSLNAESANTIANVSALSTLFGNFEELQTTNTSNVVAAINEVYTKSTTNVNIASGNHITVSGNISGNYLLGNGSLLTGISVDSTRIINGTTSLSTILNGNITAKISNVTIMTMDKFANNSANIFVNGLFTANTVQVRKVQDSSGRVLRIVDESNVVIWGE